MLRKRNKTARIKRANGVTVPAELMKKHGGPKLLPGQIADISRRHFLYLGIDKQVHIARIGKPFRVTPMPVPGREKFRPIVATAHGFQ